MILEFNRDKTSLSKRTNDEIHAIHALYYGFMSHMAINVRGRLRFSWHKQKHAETTTYCALQVRCSLVNDSIFPLEKRARLTQTSVPSVLKKGNLFMQATLRKNQRIRTKPSKWAEIINLNLPKTENV